MSPAPLPIWQDADSLPPSQSPLICTRRTPSGNVRPFFVPSSQSWADFLRRVDFFVEAGQAVQGRDRDRRNVGQHGGRRGAPHLLCVRLFPAFLAQVCSLTPVCSDIGSRECYTATLFVCYDLIRPDQAQFLSWRSGLNDFTMPCTSMERGATVR